MPPEAGLLLAFQERHVEYLAPAVGEQRGKPAAHGGGQSQEEGGRPVFEVLDPAVAQGTEMRGALARAQAAFRDRAKASSRLLPLAFLVVDAETLVQVPVVSNALDLRPGGTGERLYSDWHYAHFEVSLTRLP